VNVSSELASAYCLVEWEQAFYAQISVIFYRNKST